MFDMTYSLPLNNAGLKGATSAPPPHSWTSVYNFWLLKIFTSSLLLIGRHTDNSNNQLINILYVVCIIYTILHFINFIKKIIRKIHLQLIKLNCIITKIFILALFTVSRLTRRRRGWICSLRDHTSTIGGGGGRWGRRGRHSWYHFYLKQK